MQKNKYLMICFIIIIIVGFAATLYVGSREKEMQQARIPKLEEGVNVYELENEIFSILGPDNVAITTNRSSGSGILWQKTKDKLIVVTAAHLVSDFEAGEVELWSGEKVSFGAKDVIEFAENDVAVLCITLEEQVKLEHTGVYEHCVENIPEIGEKMWILDSVYGAGSGIGNAQVSAVNIFLEDYGTEMLLLTGTGKAGMSGCPIYDETGRLVGMVSGMSEDGTTLAAVSVEQIKLDLLSKKF